MNAITPFYFDAHAIRAIDRDGQAWFVATDVCAALGLSNPSMAIAPLDDDERAKLNLGRQGNATIISEGGLYTIMLRSRYATTPGSPAHRFRKWVTGKVLPALRRDGSYGPPPALDDPATLRGLLLGYSERVLALEHRATELEGENAALAPKADALHRIAMSDGGMNITAAAKTLQVKPRALAEWMRENRWTYRRPNSDRILAYQEKIDAGYLEHKLVTFQTDGMPSRSTFQVMVTPLGVAKLAELRAAERAAA